MALGKSVASDVAAERWPVDVQNIPEAEWPRLAEALLSELFGRSCWVAYQEKEAHPGTDSFSIGLHEAICSTERRWLRDAIGLPDSSAQKQRERSALKKAVMKARECLLCVAREGDQYQVEHRKNTTKLQKELYELKSRRFFLNFLLYRPSSLPVPRPDELDQDGCGRFDDHIHLKEADRSVPMTPEENEREQALKSHYQFGRLPCSLPFRYHMESFGEYFRKEQLTLEEFLRLHPDDLAGALAAFGLEDVGGPFTDTSKSVLDIVHSGTQIGRSQRASAIRSLVLRAQLVIVRRRLQFSSPVPG
ncbi:hypothetical protein CALCODRAFT_225660 [Calocera cornea HHB12733]|uniref:Uncharacterized protein n=1 Tax=Calocera cornea HHB12733 TaxID=1353952 RepID=A0A165C0X0_9BASI|nr:hypothetical protein CALCODRAFT_225660 [Calocera cornea HHB12733]